MPVTYYGMPPFINKTKIDEQFLLNEEYTKLILEFKKLGMNLGRFNLVGRKKLLPKLF
jgi:hypothetical protein